MTETKIDDPSVYREYFEVVKAFNSSNNDYLVHTTDIMNQRQQAIKQAIETHLNPVISTMRTFQLVSGLIAFFGLIFFCSGLGLFNQLSNNSSTTTTATSIAQGGGGTLAVLAGLGCGVIALIVFIWASAKVNELASKARTAQNAPAPEILN